MVIRKNDIVVLLKDITHCKNAEGTPVAAKGERSKVLAVDREKNRVVVEHTNYRWRHVRPSQDNPRGGRVQKESAIHASNVQLYCEKCRSGCRVRIERRDNSKVRVCAKCGNVIPVVL